MGLTFHPGDKWSWYHAHGYTPSIVTAYLPRATEHPASLSGFVGMVAHEERHELDFYDVIWQGGGYQQPADGDNDWLRNAWETDKGGWETAGLYEDNRGGFGTPEKNEGYYFETTAANFAWSDVRADAAAKSAVDSNRRIDSEDWSDLKVGSDVVHVFLSTLGSPNPQRFVFRSEATQSGNNKHYQPQEVTP